FLCAILASLSYPAIASSLQDQLSAVAEAEQQGKNEEQRQHDEFAYEINSKAVSTTDQMLQKLTQL
ncbi:hypothetical protein E2K60_24800, partial [Escherichia coli]